MMRMLRLLPPNLALLNLNEKLVIGQIHAIDEPRAAFEKPEGKDVGMEKSQERPTGNAADQGLERLVANGSVFREQFLPADRRVQARGRFLTGVAIVPLQPESPAFAQHIMQIRLAD